MEELSFIKINLLYRIGPKPGQLVDQANELAQTNALYRERFPRATAEMERRLDELLACLTEATGECLSASRTSSNSSTSRERDRCRSPSQSVCRSPSQNVLDSPACAFRGRDTPSGSSTATQSPAARSPNAEAAPRLPGAKSPKPCASPKSPKPMQLSPSPCENARTRKNSRDGSPAVHPVDAVAHFLLRQLAGLVRDCLTKARDSLLSTAYFAQLNDNVANLLGDVRYSSCKYIPQMSTGLFWICICPTRKRS